MNFFEHQAAARRVSTRLVVLFALAVVGIVVAVVGAGVRFPRLVAVWSLAIKGFGRLCPETPATSTDRAGDCGETALIAVLGPGRGGPQLRFENCTVCRIEADGCVFKWSRRCSQLDVAAECS